MATAYTPGLTVSRSVTVRKTRRLPLPGQVLVEAGARVEPHDVLARAELPGIMRTVRAAELLGQDPADLPQYLLVKEGDQVEKGDVLCRSTSFFGLFKNECRAPVAGRVEMINPVSGNIGIREAPSPVEVTAYIRGTVSEILPREGAVVEAQGALIQGIFGVGGERIGRIRVVAQGPDRDVSPEDIPGDVGGCVVVGGSGASLGAIRAAAEKGAVGFVVGGVVDEDLIGYLGHDIGVAITGQEPVPMTLILTEGFGSLRMADRTWELFEELEGETASINGATQIRAGVIRPEVIVPRDSAAGEAVTPGRGVLEVGSTIRIIREPNFGMLGEVVDLPAQLQTVPSGATVRVLVARLSDGRVVTVPRANVELIEK